MPNEIDFEEFAQLQLKQKEAWHTIVSPKSKYILYGGAAGGGKSYLLRWCAVGLAMYYYARYGIQRVPIGLFSEDYPTLRDRQVTKIMREFPSWLGILKETQRDGLAFYLDAKYGAGVVMLRNLDDPSKYASVEFAAILVEELTKNPYETFEDLRTRLRFPGVQERKFVGATNPGQVGHGWVKRLWVKPDKDNPDQEQDKFFFIPAKYSDNQYNPEDYGVQLSSIRDEQKRKALLDGDWDQFAGQYFDEWRQNLHVIPRFIPKQGSLIVGGMDWGRTSRPSHKTAFYFSLDMIEKVFYEDIAFYRCKTFFEVAGKEKDPKDWTMDIKIGLSRYGLTISDIAWTRGDPAMFKKKDDGSISIADMFRNEGIVIREANNDRIPGWMVLHNWLSLAPDGKPYWQVAENCQNLVRTFPELVHDENIVEDVDSEGEDHPGDAERYKHKHLKWIDARVGGVLTGNLQTRRAPHFEAITTEGKQIAIDLTKFEKPKDSGSERVINTQ